MHDKRNMIAFAFTLVALGFVLSLWPLAVLGILFAAARGRIATAILLGLLLDIAYGAPLGVLHFLYVPFTLLALVAVLVHLFVVRRLFEKSPQETL